ncbi:putative molybdenum carrier protein [Gammaproteobacteria bacterium AB-CW1]|uniref:Molybdenum carrier protein n=1 Tax=Natronospira elongata TaxID=3110268 RepID=A0AAP6JGZ8_9GAMM|nr:putative molybdenum carrier protein [Gammaproteobacteria bacterium AB-CW1]
MKASGLQKIVSGGQTGVDRGALDAALEHGMAEDGAIPDGTLGGD